MKWYIRCRHLKSNVYGDVVFFTEKSRLLKSIYPSKEGVCRNIWQNKNFAIPGFGDKAFKVNRSVTEKFLRQTCETTHVEEHSQSLMTKKWARRRYVCGACRVDFSYRTETYWKCVK